METVKPVVATLRGKRLCPPPIWLMRQAGRYLPEYRELRNRVPSFLELCYSPREASVVTLQPIERFGLDAAILFSDILVVPHALGQDVDFEDGKGPQLAPVRDSSGLAALSINHLQEALSPVYETVERTFQKLPDQTTLIGFAGAPWTVATYMVEGGSSRNYVNLKRWAYNDPMGFQSLIDLLVEATTLHLQSQIRAGAEAVQLFDTWAGILPKSQFDRYSAAPVREIARRVKLSHPEVPVIAFLRCNSTHLEDLASDPLIDAIGIDTAVDPRWAAQNLQDSSTVQGNLDPVLLLCGGTALSREARRIVEVLSEGPHVFNLGHGILPQTPVDHVKQLIAAVRGERGQ